MDKVGHHALPDGFDDRMRTLARVADRMARGEMDPIMQSRAAVEMSRQLRDMAEFPRRR